MEKIHKWQIEYLEKLGDNLIKVTQAKIEALKDVLGLIDERIKMLKELMNESRMYKEWKEKFT